jgi:hypothetical protein
LTKKGEVYVWGGHFKGKRGDDPDDRPHREQALQNASRSYLYHVPCFIKAFQDIKII